jgi:uncharacterized membrane protein (TIGR02234 family)
MTSDRPAADRERRRAAALTPRRELLVVLLLGVAGAGLVFLAIRQGWAQVRTAVPAPLPTSVVTDSGERLVPYASALAIASLASLAAVLATRRAARRVVGVLLTCLGAGIAAAAIGGVSTAAALAAATGNISPGTGAGAGTSAGSVTEGGSSASSVVPQVAGFHSHVVLTAGTWQAMTVFGALAIIGAGVLVTWRADRLPVMSARYDSPAGSAGPASTGSASTGPGSTGPGSAGSGSTGSASAPSGSRGWHSGGPDGDRDGGRADGAEPDAAARSRADSASMWESLSRGEDPTSARPR